MKKANILTLLIIFGFLVTACGAAMRSAPTMLEGGQGVSVSYDVAGESYDYEPAESGYAAPRDAPVYSMDNSTETSLNERIVIRNANLSLVVNDPTESSNQIAAMAEEMGGFVVNMNVYQTTFDSGVEGERASITIRVPVERLDEALETIKAGAIEVRNETVSGQDVTEEYTDLQSRLRHLEAVEQQLLGFLEEARDTEDALSVFSQLEQKQAEIEVIKGRIQYLENSARLSMISVELQPDVAERPLQIGNWRPVGTAKSAIEALLNTLQFLGDVLIVLVLYVLPIAVVIAIILWPLRKLYRHFRPKKEKALAKEE
ncbi:MAG: DUF4349 domain-containing protein [Anaerolineales bacterium]|jgi:hypothetical protein